jgi:hypothetical protein
VEGALTDADTEIIWLLFSQCTRGEGAFYEAYSVTRSTAGALK